MICRATKGKFKKFADLKKLNWTEKKVERFMKVSDGGGGDQKGG